MKPPGYAWRRWVCACVDRGPCASRVPTLLAVEAKLLPKRQALLVQLRFDPIHEPPFLRVHVRRKVARRPRGAGAPTKWEHPTATPAAAPAAKEQAAVFLLLGFVLRAEYFTRQQVNINKEPSRRSQHAPKQPNLRQIAVGSCQGQSGDIPQGSPCANGPVKCTTRLARSFLSHTLTHAHTETCGEQCRL